MKYSELAPSRMLGYRGDKLKREVKNSRSHNASHSRYWWKRPMFRGIRERFVNRFATTVPVVWVFRS